VLRDGRPGLPLNLEMLTRDPLKIPCETERYWATFPDLPGRHLARTLSFARSHPAPTPLPRPSRLDPAARLRLEDDNIRRCLVYARDRLAAPS
jgi:hypothetical protein